MPTIELDCNSDADVNVHTHTPEQALPLVIDSVRAWLNEAGFADVTFDVKTVFGPAGGASVIDFTAPNDDRLREFVIMYDAGNGEAEWLLAEYAS